MALQDEIRRLQQENPKDKFIANIQAMAAERINSYATECYNTICQKIANEHVYKINSSDHYIVVTEQLSFLYDNQVAKMKNDYCIPVTFNYLELLPDLTMNFDGDAIRLMLAKHNERSFFHRDDRAYGQGLTLTNSGQQFYKKLTTLCSKDDIIITAKERFRISKSSMFKHGTNDTYVFLPLGKDYNCHTLNSKNDVSSAFLIIEYNWLGG